MSIFIKQTYDPFIDYIKGLAIICVVLTHNIPAQGQELILFGLWGGQAVPIFLLIQVFHTVRYFADGKRTLTEYFNLNKIFKRIVLPFILLYFCQIFIFLVTGNLSIEVIKSSIVGGGIGPGSYYFWIYIQFWLLIPLVLRLSRRLNNLMGGGKLFVLICVVITILFEMICSICNISESIYRLLFLRYFFLIYLGIQLYYGEDRRSWLEYCFGFAGLGFIIMQIFFDVNLEPLIFNTAWEIAHFPAYLYVVFLLLPLLKRFYIKADLIEQIGRYSYEIFLLQMFVFTFMPSVMSRLSFIGENIYLYYMIFILSTTILSIFPVLLYKRIRVLK